MKKFLSLALALVMTMSLVTIGASATFTDTSDIEYVEAVDVIAALEIVGGYADGSFSPDGTLTRGAAAKIICNMILGPTTAGALTADAAPFPDVAASHVFAGYIAYCVQQGILSGYADGNFYPEGSVTGYQFMKMLLVALGYDSTTEGFTGDNWSVNVAKLALSLGLEDGNDDFIGTTAMTREEACLYAFNTLQATMVEYDNTSSFTVGDISFSTSSKATEVANEKSTYDLDEDDYDTMEFCEKYFDDLETYAEDDAFGRPSTVWELDGDEIGTYSDEAEATFTGVTYKDDMYDVVGKSLFEDLEDSEEDGECDLTVWIDGEDEEIDADDIEDYIKSSSSTSIAGRGSSTEVYVDDDDNVTIVIINTYLVLASDDYDDDDEELDIEEVDDIDYPCSIQSIIENDDVYVEDFEEDDYIIVTIADDEIQTAVLAEVITETVTTYSSSSSVTMGGEKYYYNANVDTSMKATSYTIGEDATVVLDAQGNIAYVEEASVSTGKYVFIGEVDTDSAILSSSFDVYAAAYFVDGTYAEIELDEIYGDDADDVYTEMGASAIEGMWYTYKANSDGTYDLKEVEDDYLSSTEAYDGYYEADVDMNFFDDGDYDDEDVISSGSVTFTAASGGSKSESIKGNSSTVFVIVDEDDDMYTYTGISNVADITVDGEGEAFVYALMDGSYAAYVFVDASDADVDGSSNSASDYIFALYLDNTTYDEDDVLVYGYEALVDGAIDDVFVSDDDYGQLEVGMLYYDVTVDGSDYITDAEEVDGDEDDHLVFELDDEILDRSDDILIFEEAGYELIVGDDAVIYVIVAGTEANDDLLDDDGADYETYEYSTAKSTANLLDEYEISGTVYTVLDDDDSDTILAMYIYITASTEI